jgi:hypothetical protein
VVNSKRKGKEGEREFAHLCQTFGFQARRGQQYRGGPDSPDVVGLPFLHVEVKRRERVDLYAAMEQSELDAGVGEIPVVAHRKNNRYWLVTLRADYFFQLYQAFLDRKGVAVDAGEETECGLCLGGSTEGVGEEPPEER